MSTEVIVGWQPNRILARALRIPGGPELPATATVTLAPTAANTDATVTITPSDADTSTDGHQINTPAGVFTDVTITVTRGDDTETYTIKLSRP